MRLSKTQLVCGVDPQVARTIARECNLRDMDAESIAHRLKITPSEVDELLDALVGGAYLTKKTVTAESGEVFVRYATTISGGALSQATFSKPISREKATELLAGLVERADAFNNLPRKPLFIERVTVFGSYLDPEVQSLGDLDIHIEFAYRTPEATEPEWMLDYAYASGRSFNTIVDALGWGEREATLYLRNKSQYISITTEDLTGLTDRTSTVFSRS